MFLFLLLAAASWLANLTTFGANAVATLLNHSHHVVAVKGISLSASLTHT